MQRDGGRHDDVPFEDVIVEFREALQEGLRLEARLAELLQQQSDGTLQEGDEEELVRKQRSVEMVRADELRLYRDVKKAFGRQSTREKKRILRVARGDAHGNNRDSDLLSAIFPAFRKIKDLMDGEFTDIGTTMSRAKKNIARQVRYIANEVSKDDKRELVKEKEAYKRSTPLPRRSLRNLS